MNRVGLIACTARRLFWLSLVAVCLQSAEAKPAEETFQVLRTRTGSYTNVTVTTKAKSYIFILHARGMANIRVEDLPPKVQQQLGYKAADPKKTWNSKRSEIQQAASKELAGVNKSIQPMLEKLRSELPFLRPGFKPSSVELYTALAILLLGYLFFCFCCHLICLKAKSPPSILIWVPGLQLIPLFRAAGMSGWWFLGCFVPLLNILAQILWSLKIVKARAKAWWVSILLILPVTNLLAFLYLAFSSGAPDEEPQKYRSMALQTA